MPEAPIDADADAGADADATDADRKFIEGLSLNAVQLSHIAATHRLEIRGNGGCAKIEVHSN